MKKLWIWILRAIAVASCGALITGCAVVSAISPDRYLANIEVTDVNLASVPDGTYTGAYTIVVPPGHYAMFRSLSVSVTVSAGAYSKIVIEKPKSLADSDDFKSFVGRIEAQNSLLVDGVSGATYSSKAMLKAVEAAVSR